MSDSNKFIGVDSYMLKSENLSQKCELDFAQNTTV
jgi:hypothetical protein